MIERAVEMHAKAKAYDMRPIYRNCMIYLGFMGAFQTLKARGPYLRTYEAQFRQKRSRYYTIVYV